MQQRQAIVPSTAVYPPPRGLLGPACRRPSQLLFRYPHSKTTEIDRDDSEAVVLLRRQLQAASRRRTSQVCDGDDNGEAEEDVDDEVQSVDEEVDYDDEGVVVAHAGQRLLPVLILRQRWRRRESRSAMACLYLKFRQGVLRPVWMAARRFGRANLKTALLCGSI